MCDKPAVRVEGDRVYLAALVGEREVPTHEILDVREAAGGVDQLQATVGRHNFEEASRGMCHGLAEEEFHARARVPRARDATRSASKDEEAGGLTERGNDTQRGDVAGRLGLERHLAAV